MVLQFQVAGGFFLFYEVKDNVGSPCSCQTLSYNPKRHKITKKRQTLEQKTNEPKTYKQKGQQGYGTMYISSCFMTEYMKNRT